MPVNVPFWQVPASLWDTMHRVGLRSHFIASQFAVPLMLPWKRGLIVNTSSGGGVRYTFNVPFGVQKSGVDRMARDMAHELKAFGIAAVSIWPGYIKSEKQRSSTCQLLGVDRKRAAKTNRVLHG